MKSGLHLKLTQHFALTPQLQQSIKLLQLSTVELNQEIEKALSENIFLEREDDDSGADAHFVDGRDGAAARSDAAADGVEVDREPFTAPVHRNARDGGNGDFIATRRSVGPTLREHLRQQLDVLPLSLRDRELGHLIIDALDDNGYLPQALEDVQQWLPAALEVSLDELRVALKHVQALDPAGVGARSVSECLHLQLQQLPPSPERTIAETLATHHLDALAAHDFNALRRTLGCGQDALRGAYALIRSLNPKPGAAFSPDETRYIAPDVVVRKSGKGWIALLNHEVVPRLRVNHAYVEAVKRCRDGARFSAQAQEARWMIKNIRQRLNTILKVSQAIVDRQHNFFEHGEIAMRPLVLREIAETVGLHESTVSRVTSQKYMLTPRGTFELKYFFGSHVATQTGGACSATAIRAMIRQLVNAEDRHKPISDNEIARILGDQGIMVARRTVAKYRESMNIAAVNLRRSL